MSDTPRHLMSGTRRITNEDRRRALLHEIRNSRSPLTITPGMRKAFEQRKAEARKRHRIGRACDSFFTVVFAGGAVASLVMLSATRQWGLVPAVVVSILLTYKAWTGGRTRAI